MLADLRQLLCPRRAKILGILRDLCRYADDLRDLARRSDFLHVQRTSDSVMRSSDVLRFAQRTLAECAQILCARSAEIPENYFASFSRDFGAKFA